MYTQSSVKTKPAAKGKADANFFMDRAYKLRAEYISTSIRNVKSWLKSHVQQIYCKLFICGSPLHH